MEIKRKDNIRYQRKEPRSKETIPSKEQYIQTLNNLITSHNFECYKVVRMGCEMGLSRQDIVNIETSNIDRYHPRGLWIEISKRVNRGTKEKPNYEMRSREVPINQNLYAYLMTSLDKKSKYLIKKTKGIINKPYTIQRVDELYKEAQIPWSPHKSRHLFKTLVWEWMRKNRQIDPGLMKELMGHKKSVDEEYGFIGWDYKLEVMDKVFG
jgi:hypothetical protein